MDESRLARRVMMAEVNGGRVRGKPRFGWMEGVKVALGNRGMTVDAARRCARDRNQWRALVRMQMIEFHAAIFAWFLCSFPSDRPPVLWVLIHLETGGMPFYDGIGINWKRAQLLK